MNKKFELLREAIGCYKANHVSGQVNEEALLEFVDELEKLTAPDLNKSEIKTGDLLMQVDGQRGCYGKPSYSVTIYEKSPINDGSGYIYKVVPGGHVVRTSSWWVYVSQAIRIDKTRLPEGFIYAFYHGMSSINATSIDGDFLHIINHSDWKKYKIPKIKKSVLKIEDFFKPKS